MRFPYHSYKLIKKSKGTRIELHALERTITSLLVTALNPFAAHLQHNLVPRASWRLRGHLVPRSPWYEVGFNEVVNNDIMLFMLDGNIVTALFDHLSCELVNKVEQPFYQ